MLKRYVILYLNIQLSQAMKASQFINYKTFSFPRRGSKLYFRNQDNALVERVAYQRFPRPRSDPITIIY